MKNLTLLLLLLCALAFSSNAQTTAFTYQGRLTDASMPATGTYDFQFQLYSPLGTVGSAVNADDIQVSNGTFTVTLDFGENFTQASITGNSRTLEIRIRPGASTGAYTTLTPRQPVTAAPLAIASINSQKLGGAAASSYLQTNGSGASLTNLNASNIASGTLDDARLSPNVALRNSVNTFTGNQTITGDLSQTGALADFNLTTGILARGTFTGDVSGANIPAEGAGTRMMWYPGRAAFRAGYIAGNQWDAANIGSYSTALGQNTRASADNSFAVGRSAVAAQTGAVAIGEGVTASGLSSIALGYGAHTNARQGTFVFADRSAPLFYNNDGTIDTTNSDLFRAAVNQSANWRVSGGFRIFTSSNLSTGVTIQSGATMSNWCSQTNAVISTSTCAYLSTSGVWTDNSSVHMKTNFAAVTSRDVLRKVLGLRIQTWNYKVDAPAIRHIGVMAQDFRAAFNVGADDEHITAVDTAGVSMAAIQGLNEELQDELKTRDAKIEAQQKAIERQQREIDELKAVVCSIKPDAAVCKGMKIE